MDLTWLWSILQAISVAIIIGLWKYSYDAVKEGQNTKNALEQLAKDQKAALDQWTKDKEDLEKKIQGAVVQMNKDLNAVKENLNDKIEEVDSNLRNREPLPCCQEIFRSLSSNIATLNGNINTLTEILKRDRN